MINVPLPSQSQSTSENQAEAEQNAPCSSGIALEESIEENLSQGTLSHKRDVGASGAGFSLATGTAAMADPTGIVRAARTGWGLFQIGKVSADAKRIHDDCEDLPVSDTDPDNE